MGWVGASVAVDIVTSAATVGLLAAGMLRPTWRRTVTLACWGLCLAAWPTLPLIVARTS